MAMNCGHYASKEEQLERILKNLCPACDIPLAPHTQVIPHGFCKCCNECRIFEDGTSRYVIHT